MKHSLCFDFNDHLCGATVLDLASDTHTHTHTHTQIHMHAHEYTHTNTYTGNVSFYTWRSEPASKAKKRTVAELSWNLAQINSIS